MLDLETAKKIVNSLINKKVPLGKMGCVIIDSKTYETPSCWVFSWLPKKIFETEGENGIGIGNMPILVDKSDGSVHVMKPTQTVEQFAQEYEFQKIPFKKILPSGIIVDRD